jgi:competence protein ComEC
VAERIIAPYLWSRGIRKLDAVILSHGDLDHYNGLPRLAEQFRIGEVYVNPSFWEKGGAAVQLVQATLRQHGVSVRVLDNSIQALSEGPPAAGAGALPMNGRALRAGSNPWRAGTSSANAGIFAVEVLHPPPHGPSGPENARSLVVLLRYANHQVLLTGDLEEPGLTQVLPRVRGPVEILWAPHHGSPRSNTAAWADACRPGLVIIGCGRRDRPNRAVYQAIGATVWETWREGAVLITMDRQGVRATTYRTRRLWAR